MTLPKNLDTTDLDILVAVASQSGTTTRVIQNRIALSRVQTLRRIERLTNLGLIARSEGERGKAYRYAATSVVTLEEISQYYTGVPQVADPVARNALKILVEGMAEVLSRLESILKQNSDRTIE